MARVTLQDIADQVGLSKFAVSRALAGKGGVSAATRVRVETVATELGYDRLPAFRQYNDVQLIFHDHDPVNSELAMQIQSGVQFEAASAKVPLRIGWTHDAEQVGRLARESRGLILFGPHAPDVINAVLQSGTPMVRVGWLNPLDQIDQVMGADHEAGAAVGNYLLARGHRSIAYVHGAPGLRGRMERLYGLREAIEVDPDARIHELKFTENAAFIEKFGKLRDGGANVTAFFCAHDGLAVTVISELLRLGYHIPQDMTVIGYGDFTASQQITPQLTTVRLPGRDMGIAALRLLLDRIRLGSKNIESAQRLYMVPRIVERSSSGPAKLP